MVIKNNGVKIVNKHLHFKNNWGKMPKSCLKIASITLENRKWKIDSIDTII